MSKITEFLNELTALSEKYGIYIQGCGCCGSPWLYIEGESSLDNLHYTDNGYTVDDLEVRT